MKKNICISCFFLLASFMGSSKNLYHIANEHYYAAFQGKKVFCSSEHSDKIFVTIKGNQVTIVIGKKKITGTYKKSKILITNDPSEIEYRKYASAKYHYGTYYVIDKKYVSILLSENGEYDYYPLCK